jgi:hypothetical protein
MRHHAVIEIGGQETELDVVERPVHFGGCELIEATLEALNDVGLRRELLYGGKRRDRRQWHLGASRSLGRLSMAGRGRGKRHPQNQEQQKGPHSMDQRRAAVPRFRRKPAMRRSER